ncbi:hypothetical protein BGZ93_004080 [Podila epicladia]|nr:hypothetical protein BGZ93_004080 [Podila epicladia]
MKVIKSQSSISTRNQARILEYMPELQELHIGREFQRPMTISSIQNLHINADSLRIWSLPHLYSLLHPTFTHSTKNLQELRIQIVNYGVNGLVEVLRRVNPDLRVLDTDCFVNYPIEDWHNGLILLPPPALDLQGTLPQFNLRSLRLSGLCAPHILFAPARPRDEKIVEQSEELAAGSVWWGCLPNLVEFATQFVAPATLIGIADNCPQIEILDVSLAQKGSSAVAYILTKCSKLKSFTGKGHMIDATHLVQSPMWVCRDIERLHIEVHGIPRAGSQGSRTGDDQVLEHAMVSNFRSLETTFGEFEYLHPLLKNSLELSLVSGLYLLVGFKNLQRIGVQEVDLSVGQEELNWMKEHWQLEAWIGLMPSVGAVLEESDAQKGDDGYYSTKNLRLLRMIKETWPSISAS